jgi:hemolysin activation/secretion protein
MNVMNLTASSNPGFSSLASILLLLLAMFGGAGDAVPAERSPTDTAAVEKRGIPNDEKLEAMGAVVGTIMFTRMNVFDTTQEGENNSLYRLANRLHIMTRESRIFSQLLFREGDLFSRRTLEESERLLRRNEYLYDAKISIASYKDGVVDIVVWTRDLWTLMPDISLSRTGGENKTGLAISEKNLLGYGSQISVSWSDTVDRESTSFAFFDRNLLKSRTSLQVRLSDNSDGSVERLRVARPFFALDTRWSAETDLLNAEFENQFYELGDAVAEYRQQSEYYTLNGGWSAGLERGWVRRWTAGLVFDDRQFSEVLDGTLEVLVPEDRRLIYPTVGLVLLEDNFKTSINRDQIGRTEDFFLGTRLAANLGYASENFDSDRDALIYSASLNRGFGAIEKKALLLSSKFSGRIEEDNSADTRFHVNARYYSQQSEKRLFKVTIDATWGQNLDLDNVLELGGDSGLRGYPLRYQTGDSRALISVEERYFTDWYPFRLFRMGFAVFADVGRTWGENPAGGESLGWLKDVGFGLRFAPTRSSKNKIFHIDVAFPLDGDPSIDSIQLLLTSSRGF